MTPGGCLAAVRSGRPLIHQLTPPVTAYAAAAAATALGAAPVMAEDPEDAAAMAAAADALVLNLGMPRPDRLEAMRRAAAARRPGVPVVLDPVGAGASAVRTRLAAELIADCRPGLIRANAAEVGALCGRGGRVRGVDAVVPPADVAAAAAELARRTGAVVAATGAVDHVAAPDGRRLAVENGHALAARLSGAGCMATAVVAAFAAVADDALQGAAHGLACFGVACERAAGRARGPGSLLISLWDELAGLTPEALDAAARLGGGAPAGEGG